MNSIAKKTAPALILALLMTAAVLITPEHTSAADTGRQSALGYEVDLFPTAISATAGETGYAFQTWAGIDRVKIRLVGAHLVLPDSLAGNDNFEDREMTVGALIFDYVFGENFQGFWFGTGVELWQNRIRHTGSGEQADWITGVLTAGGGYIFKVYGNLYLNPWAALHYVMNNREIVIAGDSFEQSPVQFSVSLKIGYYFSL